MELDTLNEGRRTESSIELLGPYVPSLVAEWLRDQPDDRYRRIDCTLVFADVSGFTRLTEMLGVQGKIGAEEMESIINGTFEKLLEPAYRYGAGLIKWGGDATLLFFSGAGHVERGCRAAAEMQAVMRREGGLRTSRGSLRLRMSIGVHTGGVDFLLVGERHRELVVTGPATTVLTRMEKVAGPGQIVVSPATAEALAAAGHRRPVVAVEPGLLLQEPPVAEPQPAPLAHIGFDGVDIGLALCDELRHHILNGGLDREHRHVAIGFLEFTGVDGLLATEGPAAVVDAVEHVVGVTEEAAWSNQVTFLMSDIGADGGRVMLSAGAPRRAGNDEDRMIATLRTVINHGGVLGVRAGVNAGRAFSGDYGPPYRRTYSAMGDCVNLAARLMAHAGAGELVATAALLRSVNGSFVTTVRPPFTAKGKRDPVLSFTIGEPVAARQNAPPEEHTPMIGRERELAVLLRADQMAASGAGRAIEIVGGPGFGKSRLLVEFRARSSSDVLWTDGDIYAAARPYAPFERLLRERWAIPAGTPPAVLAERVHAITLERAPHLIPWLPMIALVAAIELPSTPEVEQIDRALHTERMEELTSEWLGAVLSGPTVLIFNDLQLMDDASRDLIDRLAADAAGRPWLVIVARRPGSDPHRVGHGGDTLELGPLSDVAVEQLLAGATEAAPLPPHKLSAVAQRAGGNPLFLRELVAQVNAGDNPDALPQSVEGAIAARIDRLTPADRRTLRTASVLGGVIETRLLEEVLGAEAGGDGRADALLAPLSEFVEPVDESRWRFPQQLVREVAYEGLPYRRRTELHATTAAAIERVAGNEIDAQAELLSLHHLHGAQFEAAWRYSRLAAEHARERFALAAAAESYQRALAAASHLELDQADLADVNEVLGDIYVDVGQLAAADVALRRAYRRVRGTPLAEAGVELKLARLRETSGRYVAALGWLRRAEATLSELDGAQARAFRAQLAAQRARIRYRQGRHADALAAADVAIELGRDGAGASTLAAALEYADLAAVELGLPAGQRAEEALAIYEDLGDVGSAGRVANTLGMLAFYAGRWPAALERYRAAGVAWTRAGMLKSAAFSDANCAEILIDQSRLDEAVAALQRALLTWRGANAAPAIAFAEYQLGRIDARRGRFGAAMQRFDAARAQFQATGESTEVVIVDALTAECLVLAGAAGAALELAEETIGRAQALGGIHTATPLLHRIRGAALLAAGRRDDAVLALRESLAAARARDADHEVGFSLRALIEAGMAAGTAEAAAWENELESIAAELGIER